MGPMARHVAYQTDGGFVGVGVDLDDREGRAGEEVVRGVDAGAIDVDGLAEVDWFSELYHCACQRPLE